MLFTPFHDSIQQIDDRHHDADGDADLDEKDPGRVHFILRFHPDRHVIVIQEEIRPAQKRQPAGQCINEGADTGQHDRCFSQHIEFRIKAQDETREQHAHREQRPRLEAAARRKFTEAEDVDCIYHREGYQHAEGYIQDQTAKWFIHLIILL